MRATAIKDSKRYNERSGWGKSTSESASEVLGPREIRVSVTAGVMKLGSSFSVKVMAVEKRLLIFSIVGFCQVISKLQFVSYVA